MARQRDLYLEPYPGAGSTGLEPAFRQKGFHSGEDLPYEEDEWSPTTVTRLVSGNTASGYAWDAGTRYQGGSIAPRFWRTFQWWMFIRTDWNGSPGIRYVYEPSSTSGAFVLEYNANTGAGGGTWRIGRNIGIASGYVDFTHLITRGQWHHITVVFDDSELRFYVDGVPEHSDTSRRWFASVPEGNTTAGNQTTVAIQGHSAGGVQPAFTHGAVFRAFGHAMEDDEVATTWNRILWPGYQGMIYQLVGLGDIDIRNSGYMDNYCWSSHYEATAAGECLFNQTPPVAFPTIYHQTVPDENIEETSYDIDINTWTTGGVTAWPEKTLVKMPTVTTDATFATVVDPGGGNPKYLSIKPVASGFKAFYNYLNPACLEEWNTPHVAKGGLSITLLVKDFYQSNNRLYISIGGHRPGYEDWGPMFVMRMLDTWDLLALDATGAPATVLATVTPGTGVTRNWYFVELQYTAATRRRDGSFIGTLRSRWWAEATGINNPPGSWNLSYDVTANANHKRYLVGGVGKNFISHARLEYSGYEQVVQPMFLLDFQMNNGETSYLKYIRVKELAYTAP